MNILRSLVAGAALLALPVEAQEHRFEADPVVTVRENLVACEVLSQLQRVMDNPRSLLAGECVPLRAGDRVTPSMRQRKRIRASFPLFRSVHPGTVEIEPAASATNRGTPCSRMSTEVFFL